jgi:hypothetical protein
MEKRGTDRLGALDRVDSLGVSLGVADPGSPGRSPAGEGQ